METLEQLRFLLGLVSGITLTVLAVALKKPLEQASEYLLAKIPLAIGTWLRFRRWEKKYRRVVHDEHQYLRFVGVREGIPLARPKLEDVYVGLEIRVSSRAAHSSRTLGLGENYTLDVALRKFSQVAILGAPGSGKTTLLEHLVCVCGSTDRSDLSGLIPIYVPLRRCSFRGTTLIQQLTDPSSGLLPPDLLQGYPPGFFERRMRAGKCILLFDGLDEVLNEDDHVAAARMVETTSAVYTDCRVVVTSRLAGWRNLLGANFVQFLIRDLSRREVFGLVRQWYGAVVREETRNAGPSTVAPLQRKRVADIAMERAEEMLRVLTGTPRLMQIASTPLVLSLMCLVFYIRRDLPRRRARLYEECAAALLQLWDEHDKQLRHAGMPTLAQKVRLLEGLALYFFQNGTAEVSRREVQTVIAESLEAVACGIQPEEMLRFLEERSGLVCEKAIDIFGFTHLTFQEYFAANGLTRLADGLARLLERYDTTGADEVLLLYSGLLERSDELIRKLFDRYQSSGERRYLTAAGKAIVEAQDVGAETKGRVVEHLTSVFDTIDDVRVREPLQVILAELGVEREIVRSFGDYAVGAEIGRGGMSTVYSARDKSSGQEVALKILNAGTVAVVDRALRALRELRELRHPNLVQIRHFGCVGEQLFVAMELLNGSTLEAILGRLRGGRRPRTIEGTLTFRDAAEAPHDGDRAERVPAFGTVEYFAWVKAVMRDVCSATAYLHSVHVTHGDIKPGNVMWTGSAAKLLDLMVDNLVHGEEGPTTRTTSGRSMVGTLQYMSPERLVSNDRVDPASDIYSVGRVLEFLCAASMNRPSGLEVVQSVLRDQDGSPLFSVGLSRSAKRIVQIATALKPRERYRSADELWDALDKADLSS